MVADGDNSKRRNCCHGSGISMGARYGGCSTPGTANSGTSLTVVEDNDDNDVYVSGRVLVTTWVRAREDYV
ncbi:hypothetical protein L1987_37961 [Smallanthus sonchifolius]|uniref:Uncharacterized protein n=1 Tax=Smallanthus sonchifolius TaxID=185202 RepID=A0ACB9HJ89_9ASTR|nr:hypothetical protein L1987_37961 [Smallanthus sonchifolius]